MAKSNAQKCKAYRAKQGKQINLPMPQATEQALAELMEWHGHDDGREAIATFIHRLHELGRDGSRSLFEVSRHAFTPTDDQIQALVAEGSRTRVEV